MIRIDTPVLLVITRTGSLLLLSFESVPLEDSDRDETVGACVQGNSTDEPDNCKTTQWTCRGLILSVNGARMRGQAYGG